MRNEPIGVVDLTLVWKMFTTSIYSLYGESTVPRPPLLLKFMQMKAGSADCHFECQRRLKSLTLVDIANILIEGTKCCCKWGSV